MRPRMRVGLLAAAAAAAAVAGLACSSGTAPNGPSGGHSDTISTSDNLGPSGNYFFNPTPDTVAAGNVTWRFGTVTHNVHFGAGPFADDSIGASSNTLGTLTLTTPGTYIYQCTIHHFSGTLVIQ
jgi:plastocyanin